MIQESTILGIILGLDRALAAAILLISFSLLVYVLTHNIVSPVGRAFSALIIFVTIVYTGDVAVQNVSSTANAEFWLRCQWLGIAFVPAAYLHLSYALLNIDNNGKKNRWTFVIAYILGLVFLALVVSTDLVVYDGASITSPQMHLKAGPLFWIFAIYFTSTTILGAVNISYARRLAVTEALKRRLTYLAISFVAPGLGVFPFLVLAGAPANNVHWLVAVLTVIGNTAVMLMLIVMAYSIAYYGVLTPDRIVKQSFIEFILRGPFVGVCVLMVILAVPDDLSILGLNREAFLIFAAVGAIVLLQMIIGLIWPLIDRLAYRQDQEEISWLRELSRRLLTSGDYRQLLENLIVSGCELIRSEGGFIASLAQPDSTTLTVEAVIGGTANVPELAEVASWLKEQSQIRAQTKVNFKLSMNDVYSLDGYWLVALINSDEAIPLGIFGLRQPYGGKWSDMDLAMLNEIAGHAARAIEDMRLQRHVFTALRKLLPEIESVQFIGGNAAYGTTQAMLANPVLSPQFPNLVRMALRHYWGGPDLGDSPLLQLRVVRRAMQDSDGNPVRALRLVLVKAVEALRPEAGTRDFSPEWILYNIIDMKYIQGLKVKDISHRLAMSESDLYRKQRVAVEEVARVLAEMELYEEENGDEN